MNDKYNNVRKDRIAAILRDYTETALSTVSTPNPGIDASEIADILSLDRANVSRELNKLYRNGTAIKLLGRPTRYLHARIVNKYFSDQFVPSTIPSGETIFSIATRKPAPPATIENNPPTLVNPLFPSLKACWLQAEAAVAYPPNGLHTLLIGEHGIGKTEFVEKMFSYGKEIDRFSPKSKLYIFDCRGVIDAPRSASVQLFGSIADVGSPEPGRIGTIERAEGGILVLLEAQHLPLTVQEELTHLMSHGVFSRVGESSVKRKSHLMIIAVSCGDCDINSVPLFKHFPMVISLPALSERTPYERFLCLYQILQKESLTLNCELRLSNDVLYCLSCAALKLDIVALRRNVRSICAMAYHEGGKTGYQIIEIGYRHLSPDIRFCFVHKDQCIDFLSELAQSKRSFFSIHANSLPPTKPLATCKKLASSQQSFLYEDPSFNRIQKYIETYLSSAEKSMPALDEIESLLLHQAQIVLQSDSTLQQLSEDSPLLCSMVSIFSAAYRHNAESSIFLSESKSSKILPPENLVALAEKLETAFCRLCETPPSDARISLLALFLVVIKNHLISTHILPVFLIRGNHTSQNYADYVNSLFNCSALAINCDFSATLEDAISALDTIVIDHQDNQILLFTDGLPFTQLHRYLNQQYSMPAKTIVGTSLDSIVKTLRCVYRFNFSLKMIDHCSDFFNAEAPYALESSFLVNQAALNLLSPTLNFLDISKALPLLAESFALISKKLSLKFSDSAATKYQFHCAHMIERLVRKEPLDYSHLKTFINRHSQVFHVIEDAMSPIEQSFGIHVPASEIAYLTEIFLEQGQNLDSP